MNKRLTDKCPQLLYWKWNDEIQDEAVLTEKANDIIARSSFRDIAIAPHSMTRPEASFLHPPTVVTKNCPAGIFSTVSGSR